MSDNDKPMTCEQCGDTDHTTEQHRFHHFGGLRPVPDCICTHEGHWHRYDCPKFNVRDYTHQPAATPQGSRKCAACGAVITRNGSGHWVDAKDVGCSVFHAHSPATDAFPDELRTPQGSRDWDALIQEVVDAHSPGRSSSAHLESINRRRASIAALRSAVEQVAREKDGWMKSYEKYNEAVLRWEDEMSSLLSSTERKGEAWREIALGTPPVRGDDEISVLRQEIASLRSQLSEALDANASLVRNRWEDTERLDWLAGMSNCVVTIGGRDHYLADTDTPLREAIDAARTRTPDTGRGRDGIHEIREALAIFSHFDGHRSQYDEQRGEFTVTLFRKGRTVASATNADFLTAVRRAAGTTEEAT